MDHADPDGAASRQQTLPRVVERPIGDDDHLHRLARKSGRDGALNRADVRDDLLPAVVDGHDNAQKRRPQRAQRIYRTFTMSVFDDTAPRASRTRTVKRTGPRAGAVPEILPPTSLSPRGRPGAVHRNGPTPPRTAIVAR